MKHQKLQRPIIPEQHWLNEPTAAEWKRKYYDVLTLATVGWVVAIMFIGAALLLINNLK